MTDVTPKRSERRRLGRASVAAHRSEPPRKRLRYGAAAAGGGNRWLVEDGKEASDDATPRARRKRMPTSERAGPRRSLSGMASRSRRANPPLQPRYSSASAAATAMTQNEGYKPREERGWEEFHPDLDIEAALLVFGAEEVDGSPGSNTSPTLGASASEGPGFETLSKSTPPALSASISLSFPIADLLSTTPIRRRVGRPPKSRSMLTGLGSPPAPRIAPLPTHNPKERLNLPKPNYRKVETFAAYEQDKSVGINFVDKTLANMGYQESDRFIRPERTYIRGGEGSIEEELDRELIRRISADSSQSGPTLSRVEYDMDEQDERWLDNINAVRKAEGVEGIRPAIFEITLTQIEKEWHALEKRIPKPSPKQPQTQRPRSGSAAAVNGEPVGSGEEQDTKCAICDDGDCENVNAIVFCDGCDLAVHQECYGVPFIPEGQWLCRKCQLIGRSTPTCVFCPNIDGAFKQTNTLRWAHLLCSLWIPEVTIANTTFMEPITDVEKVPKQRWRLTCYICKQHMGACVQCANKTCYSAFHVTCARRARLFLKMKSPHGSITDHAFYKGFCHKHVSSEWRKEHDTDRAFRNAQRFYEKSMKNRRWADSQQSALAAPMTDSMDAGDRADGDLNEPLSSVAKNKRKRAELQKNIWRLPGGAPIVPEAVFERVENAMVRFALRRRREFVSEACKYWSLKREARRGAPLIKRFQAQMESFTSMEMTRRNFAAMGAAGRSRLERRIQFAELLEGDFERIKELCTLVLEREKRKCDDAQILRDLVDSLYSPIVPLLWPILEKLQTYDSNAKHYFKKGLDELRSRMEKRAVVTVIDFVIHLGKSFNEAINDNNHSEALVANGGHSGDLNSKAMVLLKKEKRNKAKRIITNIIAMLQDVTRQEVELGKKDFEAEWHRIETILSDSTSIQSGPAIGAAVDSSTGSSKAGAEDGRSAEMQAASTAYAGEATSDFNGLTRPDVESAAVDGSSRRPLMSDADTVAHPVNKDDAMKIEIRANFDSQPELDYQRDASTTSAAPALSNSGSTNPSSKSEPLTPPNINAKVTDLELLAQQDKDKDFLAPLREGGLAWYLDDFKPEGTTIYDPDSWDGRAMLREMSEELSELDDDEVDGLMADRERDVKMTDVGEETSVIRKPAATAAAQRRARSKRRRGW